MPLLRRTSTETAPFDHEGASPPDGLWNLSRENRCRQQPHILIYGGGGSDAVIGSLAPGVDVFMPGASR